MKYEFQMKDLKRIKSCWVIQVKHLSSIIFVYQSTYTEKILDRFYMDKSHLLTTPMILWSIKIKEDPFYPKTPKSQMKRFNSDPTKRYYNRIKHILRYFMEKLILDYSFRVVQNRSWSDMQMLDICQILILDDHKQVIYSCIVALLFVGNIPDMAATSANRTELLAI